MTGPLSKLRTNTYRAAVNIAEAILPVKTQVWLQSVISGQAFNPSPGTVDFGDLRRLSPLSRKYGYDRGGPIDRYYIDKFLESKSAAIAGTVLEISENTYTLKYGGDNVTASEVLHYDDPSPPATVTGDLTNAPHLPSNHYDCIIITQTLMFIYDLQGAVETLHRILKPGGRVLVTVAGFSQVADPAWLDTWHWGFTASSSRRLFEDEFVDGEVEITTYGNVLSSISFLAGASHTELTTKELEHVDPEYQLLTGIVARKAPIGA